MIIKIDENLVNLNKIALVKTWEHDLTKETYTRFYITPHEYFDIKGDHLNWISNLEW